MRCISVEDHEEYNNACTVETFQLSTERIENICGSINLCFEPRHFWCDAILGEQPASCVGVHRLSQTLAGTFTFHKVHDSI